MNDHTIAVVLAIATLLMLRQEASAQNLAQPEMRGRHAEPDTRGQAAWRPGAIYLGDLAVWTAKKGVHPHAVVLDTEAGSWRDVRLPTALAEQVRADGRIPESFAWHAAENMVWWVGRDGTYGLDVRTMKWTTIDTPSSWPGPDGRCRTLDGLWRCRKSGTQGYGPGGLVFFDLRRGRWVDPGADADTAEHSPGPRHAARWHWVGDQLVVWGGTVGPRRNFQESGAVLNTATQRWQPMPAEGAPRGIVTESVAFGEEIWMTTLSRNAADGAIFNVATRTWRALPDVIKTTSAVFVVDGRLVVWDHDNHENFVYDPTTGRAFIAQQPMPGARVSVGSGSYQATLLVVPAQRHYVLDMTAEEWVIVENPGPSHRPPKYEVSVQTACHDVVVAETCGDEHHCTQLPRHWSAPATVAHRKARCLLHPWKPGREVMGR